LSYFFNDKLVCRFTRAKILYDTNPQTGATGALAIHGDKSGIGIYTPFNDNYPDVSTCMKARTHAHIREGGNAAYVNCLRMDGYAPHKDGIAATTICGRQCFILKCIK
jgi:hypothetical protein